MSNQLELFGGESFEPRKPQKASPPTPPDFNLFLAVMPDRPAAVQARSMGAAFLTKHGASGTLRPLQKMHVTLLGFGFHTLPDETLEKIISGMKQAAQAIVPLTPRFEISFDRLVSFGAGRGNRPLVLTQDKTANGDLKRLYQAIFEEDRAVFEPMRESSYTPHMTLLYTKQEIRCEPAGPVSWMAQEIALILSERGSEEYQVLGRWFLKD